MTSAIIVAAGKGNRMGPNLDKLFFPVAGRLLIAHTWQRFENATDIDELVIVVRDDTESRLTALAHEFGFRKPYRIVAGGAERQDSVWNGLQALDPRSEIVAVQDGARPCTMPDLIAATVNAAREVGAAVAAQRVTDTIKESDGGTLVRRTVDRSHLWSVQTPQAFRVEILRKALAAVRDRGMHVTDDTAACELIGQPVRLVESRSPNPKVTVPGDLAYVELILRGAESPAG